MFSLEEKIFSERCGCDASEQRENAQWKQMEISTRGLAQSQCSSKKNKYKFRKTTPIVQDDGERASELMSWNTSSSEKKKYHVELHDVSLNNCSLQNMKKLKPPSRPNYIITICQKRCSNLIAMYMFSVSNTCHVLTAAELLFLIPTGIYC